MITIKHTGDFHNTERFFDNANNLSVEKILRKYAEEGVRVLSALTPTRTGLTAASWGYEIEGGKDRASIYWTNSNINKNVNIALILQYGHGTGTGGYVTGIDYINPATKIVFDQIAEEAWKEVTK